MIQGGSVIIADFEDMWGNVTNIGLGEHAVRTKAPPMFYDKRGNILRYVDFESPTPNYSLSNSGTSTTYRSTEQVMNGDFSMKIDNPTALDYSQIQMFNLDFHGKTVGVQFTFSVTNSKGYIELDIMYYTGTRRYRFRVNYNSTTGVIIIYSASHPPYYTVGTISSQFYQDTFSTIKLSGDYSTNLYKELLLFGTLYDISFVSPEMGFSNVPPQLLIHIGYYYDTFPTSMYIDNIIVTENE